MTYTPRMCAFAFQSDGLDLARAAAKAKLLEWLWMCAACAAIASACGRMDYTRVGMARCAVACEAPAGRAISVGFRRNCIQCIKYIFQLADFNR